MEHRRLSPLARRLAATGAAVIVVALGATVWVGFARVRQRRELVVRSREVIRAADAVLQRLTDAETGQRGFVIAGDSAYLAPYRGAKSDVEGAARRLRALTATDRDDRPRLDSLDAVIARRFALLDRWIVLRQTAGFDTARRALAAGGGRELMERSRALLAQVVAREDSLLARRRAVEEREVRLLLATILLGSLVAAVIAVLLNRLLARYAAEQERAALTLAEQNERLRDQAAELELQHEQLEEQAAELEAQWNELQEQTTELEMSNESLETTASELQERTETAERLRREADAANRAKSDFLAVMSHELRTPLNAIAGYVELLKLGVRGSLTAEQAADLERIERNGRHLQALIKDVLSFAKLEVGQVDLRMAPVCVGEIVSSLEPLVAPQIAAAGLSYSAALLPGNGGGAHVVADEEKLRQILVNLLTNAIKFTPPGGNTAVRCRCDDEHVWIAVSDTGRGIPQERLGEIFEPFVQVDRHLNREGQQGVGLGLAISRELARRMGGELTVESRPGEGSTFTLCFARARPPAGTPEHVLPVPDAPVVARGIP